MNKKRNLLYFFILAACFLGFIWIYVNLTNKHHEAKSIDVCLMKRVTNIPCPSCGVTRSVVSLTKGDFLKAFLTNPLGYIVLIIMIVAPLWVFYDFSLKKKSFFQFYQTLENYIRKPTIAVILITLVIVNWIWNIYKGL